MTLPTSIKNGVTGDRITFLLSPMSGDGDLLAFRCTLPPHGDGTPLHVHDDMTESFVVERGSLLVDLGPAGKITLSEGQEISIAAGTPHGFRNETDGEVVFVTTATPGEGLETFLRTIYALANEGMVNAKGMPRDPRALAFLLDRGNLLLAGVPHIVQRLVTFMLRGVARLTRYERRLDLMVRGS